MSGEYYTLPEALTLLTTPEGHTDIFDFVMAISAIRHCDLTQLSPEQHEMLPLLESLQKMLIQAKALEISEEEHQQITQQAQTLLPYFHR